MTVRLRARRGAARLNAAAGNVGTVCAVLPCRIGDSAAGVTVERLQTLFRDLAPQLPG